MDGEERPYDKILTCQSMHEKCIISNRNSVLQVGDELIGLSSQGLRSTDDKRYINSLIIISMLQSSALFIKVTYYYAYVRLIITCRMTRLQNFSIKFFLTVHMRALLPKIYMGMVVTRQISWITPT